MIILIGNRFLLDLDFSAGFLELISCSIGIFLGNVLLDSLRSTINKVFSFLQAETCKSRTTLITPILAAPHS